MAAANSAVDLLAPSIRAKYEALNLYAHAIKSNVNHFIHLRHSTTWRRKQTISNTNSELAKNRGKRKAANTETTTDSRKMQRSSGMQRYASFPEGYEQADCDTLGAVHLCHLFFGLFDPPPSPMSHIITHKHSLCFAHNVILARPPPSP